MRLLTIIGTFLLVFATPVHAQHIQDVEYYRYIESFEPLASIDLFIFDPTSMVYTTAKVGKISLSKTDNVRVTRAEGMICYEPADDASHVWGCAPRTATTVGVPVHGFSYLIERKCTNGDWKSDVAVCNVRGEPHVFTLALQPPDDE